MFTKRAAMHRIFSTDLRLCCRSHRSFSIRNNTTRRLHHEALSSSSWWLQQKPPLVHLLFPSRSISKKRKQQDLILSGKDPFTILGVQRTDLYAHVKHTFLKVAMKHHPDTNAASSHQEQEKHQHLFVQARQAFEAIVEGAGGVAILKSESSDHKDNDDEDEFSAWFKNQTGHEMPYMDLATMKEVAKMTESVGGGLDRDGGMWTLARMVTESVKSGGNANDVLQIEAGTVRDRQINGILRRRRRR